MALHTIRSSSVTVKSQCEMPDKWKSACSLPAKVRCVEGQLGSCCLHATVGLLGPEKALDHVLERGGLSQACSFQNGSAALWHGNRSIEAVVQETTLDISNLCAGMAHAGSSSKWRCQMSAVTE